MPSEPPSLPVIARNMRVPNIHWCSSCPRLPSGFSRLCSGPAPNPSSEIEKPATRTFVITKPFHLFRHRGLKQYESLPGSRRRAGGYSDMFPQPIASLRSMCLDPRSANNLALLIETSFETEIVLSLRASHAPAAHHWVA